jgi:glutathione S-transferase
VLEAELKAAPYLLGSTFTVADLNVATLFFRPAVARIELDAFPSVRDWIARCSQRAAFLRMEERLGLPAEP